jgi:hypothetical protein
MSHGGKRRGAGRPPGQLEDLFEIYKAVEEWRSEQGVSVKRACEQIAARGGLKWTDGRPAPVTAAAIRKAHVQAVVEIIRPSRARGITLTGVYGPRRTPGADVPSSFTASCDEIQNLFEPKPLQKRHKQK